MSRMPRLTTSTAVDPHTVVDREGTRFTATREEWAANVYDGHVAGELSTGGLPDCPTRDKDARRIATGAPRKNRPSPSQQTKPGRYLDKESIVTTLIPIPSPHPPGHPGRRGGCSMSRHAETLAALLVTAGSVLVLAWLAAQAVIDWGTLP